MAGQEKKYVFRELVQDRTDAPQLISYAIYKSHKDERAVAFRNQFGEAAVDQKLQEWHDGIVNDENWLDTYRSKADQLIKEIERQAVEDAMPGITQIHTDAIDALKEQHRIEKDALTLRVVNAEQKAQTEWAASTKAWAENQTKPGWWRANSVALLKVIGGAVVSVLGGAIATACIVGVLSIFSPTLSATANSVAKGIVDKLLPPDPTGLDVKSYTSGKDKPESENKPQ